MSLHYEHWKEVFEDDRCRRCIVRQVDNVDIVGAGIFEGMVLPIVGVSDGYVYVAAPKSAHYPMYASQIEPYLTSVRLDVPKPNQHYQTKVQAIETMQANMTHEELIGFLKGNIIKYACRCGRKDDVSKETAKIKQYAEWLDIVANGGEIVIEREEK